MSILNAPPDTPVADAVEITQSPTVAGLTAALATAQAEIRPAELDSTNPHFHSRYASLTSIRAAVIPALSKHGIAVVQLPCGQTADALVGMRTTLYLGDEWIAATLWMHPTKSDPQGIGSCLTYLQRYTLAPMVGIGFEADDDGNAASVTPVEAPARAAASGVITEKQAKRLYAITKKAGRDPSDVAAYLKSKGYADSREIRRDDYDAVCAWAEDTEDALPVFDPQEDSY